MFKSVFFYFRCCLQNQIYFYFLVVAGVLYADAPQSDHSARTFRIGSASLTSGQRCQEDRRRTFGVGVEATGPADNDAGWSCFR